MFTMVGDGMLAYIKETTACFHNIYIYMKTENPWFSYWVLSGTFLSVSETLRHNQLHSRIWAACLLLSHAQVEVCSGEGELSRALWGCGFRGKALDDSWPKQSAEKGSTPEPSQVKFFVNRLVVGIRPEPSSTPPSFSSPRTFAMPRSDTPRTTTCFVVLALLPPWPQQPGQQQSTGSRQNSFTVNF